MHASRALDARIESGPGAEHMKFNKKKRKHEEEKEENKDVKKG
jgi:hypothetical protein